MRLSNGTRFTGKRVFLSFLALSDLLQAQVRIHCIKCTEYHCLIHNSNLNMSDNVIRVLKSDKEAFGRVAGKGLTCPERVDYLRQLHVDILPRTAKMLVPGPSSTKSFQIRRISTESKEY